MKIRTGVEDSLDFLQDVWYNQVTIKWRKNLLANKRNCPIYKI